MPSARTAALAAIVGLALGAYFALWFRWPTFLAVALGATMTIVLLLFGASLAHDPEEADRAWGEAAPDLAARERAEPPVIAGEPPTGRSDAADDVAPGERPRG
ncbi:MAG TPA: hypothetical protein VM344_00730 [Vitreimonas sp.]|nr:hypothetical protein [Vitreimonas sp.]